MCHPSSFWLITFNCTILSVVVWYENICLLAGMPADKELYHYTLDDKEQILINSPASSSSLHLPQGNRNQKLLENWKLSPSILTNAKDSQRVVTRELWRQHLNHQRLPAILACPWNASTVCAWLLHLVHHEFGHNFSKRNSLLLLAGEQAHTLQHVSSRSKRSETCLIM